MEEQASKLERVARKAGTADGGGNGGATGVVEGSPAGRDDGGDSAGTDGINGSSMVAWDSERDERVADQT